MIYRLNNILFHKENNYFYVNVKESTNIDFLKIMKSKVIYYLLLMKYIQRESKDIISILT